MKFGDQEIPDGQVVALAGTVKERLNGGVRLNINGVEKWVPSRFFEINKDGKFVMPQWLAKSKGFI